MTKFSQRNSVGLAFPFYKHKSPPPVLPLVLSALLLTSPAITLAQSDIETLAQLNRMGRSAEAYAIAIRLLSQWEGEPAFDLQYGVAAIDSGAVPEGIFALERVVMNQPDNLYARLELARAYFGAGEDDRALAEFNRVLATDPPADVRQNVRPYLDAISAREGQRRAVWRGSVELTSGYDSNINAAAEEDLSPLLGLPPGSVTSANPEADSFASLNGVLSYSRPLTKLSDFALSANVSHRENASGDLPQSVMGLNASYGLRRDASSFRFGIQANQLRLENERYRDSIGLTANWRYALSPASSLSINGQVSDLAYPDSPGKDAALAIAGLTVQHVFQAPLRPVFSAGLNYGVEKAKDDTAPGALQNTERDMVGANLGLALSFSRDVQMSLSLRAQRSEYAEPLVLPPVLREDLNLSASAGLDWRLADNWMLGLNAQVTDNESNAVFTDYDRQQISATLRYLFR